MLISYLNSIVNSVFKILPLYEESNIGLESYVESLLFELRELESIMPIQNGSEYISLMQILKSISKEVASENSKKIVIKREVFKCINIIKNIIGKLEDGD